MPLRFLLIFKQNLNFFFKKVDINRKESELVNKREAHEIEMRKKKRENNQNKKDMETLTRQQKNIQELSMFECIFKLEII